MPRNNPNIHVGFRLPVDVVQALSVAAEMAGVSRTAIAVEWLRKSAQSSGIMLPLPTTES